VEAQIHSFLTSGLDYHFTLAKEPQYATKHWRYFSGMNKNSEQKRTCNMIGLDVPFLSIR
jgi:hypothetical protein